MLLDVNFRLAKKKQPFKRKHETHFTDEFFKFVKVIREGKFSLYFWLISQSTADFSEQKLLDLSCLISFTTASTGYESSIHSNGSMQYLIRWSRRSSTKNSWENKRIKKIPNFITLRFIENQTTGQPLRAVYRRLGSSDILV